MLPPTDQVVSVELELDVPAALVELAALLDELETPLDDVAALPAELAALEVDDERPTEPDELLTPAAPDEDVALSLPPPQAAVRRAVSSRPIVARERAVIGRRIDAFIECPVPPGSERPLDAWSHGSTPATRREIRASHSPHSARQAKDRSLAVRSRGGNLSACAYITRQKG
jgi:hypothetical protein